MPDTSEPAIDRRRTVIGQTFGRYQILGELGRGGMGVVYKARDPQLGRLVALKLVLHGLHVSDAALARFRREAEAVAQLQHPNIVPIFEFGEIDGLPFYTMEHLTGGDLAGSALFRFTEPRALAGLFVKLARAVHAAHERGIVHRDLKPANVLLSASGEPKVSDFGLAKRLDEDGAMTLTGTAVGTPAYMAPEQLDGDGSHAVSPASDVYALGVMLYEGLTGQRPKLPSQLNGSGRHRVPRDLETICLRCLRYTPADRYATAGELADDLNRYLSGEPVRARRTGLIVRMAKWARRRPAAALTIVLTTLAIASLAYAGWYLDAHVLTRTSRFANITYQWGVPAGVGQPLDPRHAQHHSLSFEITRRGRRGPVITLRVLNGFGYEPVDAPMRTWFDGIFASHPVQTWSRNQFEYNQTGRLTREVAYDPGGRIVYELQYSYPQPTTSGPAAQVAMARYFRDMGLDLSQVTGPTVIEFHRNAQGLDDQVRFLDGRGSPKPNHEGSFGYRYTYGGPRDLPLPRRIENLDAHGNPASSDLGFVAAEMQHDAASGWETRTSYFDRDGKPTRGAEGIASTVLEYDAFGNAIAQRFLDETGRSTVLPSLGVFELRSVRGDHGEVTRHTYADAHGQPTAASDGNARVDSRYDDHGRLISMETWELGDKLRSVADLKYEGQSRLDEMIVWQDLARQHQVGRERRTYSGESVAAELSYDAADRLFGQVTYQRDEAGRIVETTFRDGGNPPKPRHEGDGYSRIQRRYHDNGVVSENRFSGYAAGSRTAIRTERFDRHGALIARESLDAQERPIVGEGGFARQLIDRDSTTGRIIAVRYFDAAGGPVQPAVVVASAAVDLRVGDRLLRYGAEPISSAQAFYEERLFENRDYQAKPLEILREGKTLTTQIPPGHLPIELRDRVLPN
jgi:YD repeat-containing protein